MILVGVLEYSKMPAEVSGQSTGVLKKARRSRWAEYWSTQKCSPADLEYSRTPPADFGGLEYSRINVNYMGEEDSPPPLPASMSGVLRKARRCPLRPPK